MPYLSRLPAASAIAIALAGPAAAELTAQGLWQDFQDYAESYGMPIQAGEPTQTGSGLRVENVVGTFDPDGPDIATFTMPFIEFVERGDGTVAVVLPDSYLTDMTFEGEEGLGRIVLDTAIPGAEVSAAEEAGGTLYTYELPEAVMTVTEATDDGEPIPLDMSITLTDMAGTYRSSGENPTVADQNATAAGLTMSMQVDDPDTGGNVDLALGMTQLAMSAQTAFVDGLDMTNMSSAVRGGFSTNVELTYADSTFSMDVVDEDGPFKVEGGSASGGLTARIDEAGLSYATRSEGTAFALSGAAIPFPQVAVQVARTGFTLAMPILASEEPAPFALATRIEELSIDDAIWGMFDPASQLDRTPLTLIIDVSGTATLDIDIMDPEAMENADPSVPPGMPVSADINQIKLSVLGADLNGEGGFTFDASDMETFPGMPAPTGELRLSLTGANALMDQLVALGFVPEDQVMMGRMMLGMFARPAGDDAFETVIEIKDGGLFANGQQLQ